MLRRLNRHELRNTFRDLLYLNGADYRPDASGSRLIDNNGNGSVERTGNDPLRFFPEDEEEDGDSVADDREEEEDYSDYSDFDMAFEREMALAETVQRRVRFADPLDEVVET